MPLILLENHKKKKCLNALSFNQSKYAQKILKVKVYKL